MKQTLVATVFLVGAQAAAACAGTNINVNIGPPPLVVESPAPPPEVPPPPPVLVPPPPPTDSAPPPVIFQAAPRFIFSPALGFYVAVETPYDLAFIDGRYYLWYGRFWYAAPYYNGPWVMVRGKALPPGMRRFRREEIRRHRDMEYRFFLRDREHYRGGWYFPGERR